MATDDCFMFVVDFFDPQADLIRKYNLSYFSVDNSIQMYDIKNKRIFLKRTLYPDLKISDLRIGGTIHIFARPLKIVEYGDEFTREQFDQQKSNTFAIVLPDGYQNLGKIMQIINQAGLSIQRMKMARMNQSQARSLFSNKQNEESFHQFVDWIASDVVIGMELTGENAVDLWLRIMGPADVAFARQNSPGSIRAQFGSEGMRNAVYGSASGSSAQSEIAQFFALKPCAVYSSSTCCVIKPHAFSQAGKIVDWIIQAGFEISAMENFQLDRASAQEFLEVYKGVLAEWNFMVDEMISGMCIVMEIRQENVVQEFRRLCGPIDPEVCRTFNPNSIRAKFGQDIAHNAVHCTDLPEDVVLETEYFFDILQKN